MAISLSQPRAFVKGMALTILLALVWLATLVAAPMLNHANSVTVWGDNVETRSAIISAGAQIVGKKGSLLLVKRDVPDLAADLVNNGAGFVFPDAVFTQF